MYMHIILPVYTHIIKCTRNIVIIATFPLSNVAFKIRNDKIEVGNRVKILLLGAD